MDPSVFGTGSIILNKAQAALNVARSGSITPPGYGHGGFMTQNGMGQVEPLYRYLQLNWALPTGSPADFPMVLNYHSDAGVVTEFGFNWSAPHQRFAEYGALNVVSLNNPQGAVVYSAPDVEGNYAGSPNQYNNTLQGSMSSGWTETQPDGTTFNYDTTGVLRTIRNNAGVRWTLTWDSGVNFVQHIDGPLGRRTTFAYDGSNNIRYIQDPSGRLTTLTINGNNDLVRIVTPELCTTSLVYDDAHHLTAWIDPLGNRNTYSSTSFAVKSDSSQPGRQSDVRYLLIAAPATTMLNGLLPETHAWTDGTGSWVPTRGDYHDLVPGHGQWHDGHLSDRRPDADRRVPVSVQQRQPARGGDRRARQPLEPGVGQLWQPDRGDRSLQPADQLCVRFDGTADRRAQRAGPASDPALRQPGPAVGRHQPAGLSDLVRLRRQ